MEIDGEILAFMAIVLMVLGAIALIVFYGITKAIESVAHWWGRRR